MASNSMWAAVVLSFPSQLFSRQENLEKRERAVRKWKNITNQNLAQSTTTGGCPINSGNLKQQPNSKQSD